MRKFQLFIFTTFISNAIWGQSSVTPLPAPSPLKPQVTQTSLKIVDNPIQVNLEQYGESSPWTFIHLHDSEPSSLAAARQIIPLTGGQLIKIVNKGKRNLSFTYRNRPWIIDPNRIYSDTGIQLNLQELQRWNQDPKMVSSIQSFGSNLLGLIPKKTSCIISLHNNTDGFFSINDYLPGGRRARDARKVFMDRLQDPDDIVITTDSLIYEHMAAACYNTIWQNTETVRQDGSLSVYCGLRNIRYVNIETQHGQVGQYVRMLAHLMLFLTKPASSDMGERVEQISPSGAANEKTPQ